MRESLWANVCLSACALCKGMSVCVYTLCVGMLECLCICKCVCLCVNVCKHMCLCICVPACVYGTHVSEYACVHVCMYIRMCMSMCPYVRLHALVRVCLHMCVCLLFSRRKPRKRGEGYRPVLHTGSEGGLTFTLRMKSRSD